MSDETPQEPVSEPTPPPPPPVPAGTDMPYTSAMDAPAAPAGKKGRRTIALVVAVLVVIAAGGAAFAFFQLKGSSDALMSQIPASADIVATVYLDPAASQKVNLFRMTDKFPILGSESDLTQRLHTLLDQAGQSVGLNHNDFQWIGSQAAVVVDFPGAAAPNVEVLINVDDTSAAKATLDKARNSPLLGGTWHDTQYKGVTVSSSSSSGAGAYAFVGSTLVIANTTTGVDSIIDTDQGGASLADSADLKATSEGLPDGRLAFIYVNAKSLIPLASSLIPSGTAGSSPVGSSMASLDAIRGIGMTISAESNGLAMDINESLDPSKLTDAQKALIGAGHDNPLTSYVPSNALGLVEAENVNTIVNSAITQLEANDSTLAAQLETLGVTGPDGLLSSLTGDLALEIAPGTPALPVSGAVVLGINDPTKFSAAVTKLKDGLIGANGSCSFTAVGTAVGSSSNGGSSPVVSTPVKCTTAPAPKWQTETYKGTTINFITDTSGGPSIAYATADSAGLIGLGADSIKAAIDAKAGQNISSNANFTAAKDAVPSQSEFLYWDVAGTLQAASANSSDPGLSQAATVLKPITAIAIGGESTSTQSHARFLVLIP
jgi:uncharacterized protein DUF3352